MRLYVIETVLICVLLVCLDAPAAAQAKDDYCNDPPGGGVTCEAGQTASCRVIRKKCYCWCVTATPQAQLDILYAQQHNNSFLNGVNAGIALNLNGWFGLAGEVGFHCNPFPPDCNDGVIPSELPTLTVLGGGRFSHRHGAVTVFSHALGGGIFRFTDSPDIDNRTKKTPAVAVGGGMDMNFNDWLAVRMQGDAVFTWFRRLLPESLTLQRTTELTPRLSIGLVFSFGKLKTP